MFTDVFVIKYKIDVVNNKITINDVDFDLKQLLYELGSSNNILLRQFRKELVRVVIEDMRLNGWVGYDISKWFESCGGM
jgi:hypothetical protein